MLRPIVRTDAEVDEVLNGCMEQVDEGGSRWPGMSYEEGVVAALKWALGDTEDHPYPESDDV